MKRVAILGSTGSIGQSTLRLLADRQDRFQVVFLSALRSATSLLAGVTAFQVPFACLAAPGTSLPDFGATTLFRGRAGILQGLEASAPDLVVNAISGAAGLAASVWTLERGGTLLLANKESLVVAGPLLAGLLRRHGGSILPVDSEHAAIHQCLKGEERSDVRRVYLTASGGPFRDLPATAFSDVTPQQALDHPTWKMGPRITVGSATLMNKAFEVIEAHHLFGFASEEIEVLVHRQSIVHSIVEFRDGSLICQMGVPDMRVPILYCLAWPERLSFDFQPFDLRAFASLTFEAADRRRFPALEFGYHCVRAGGDAGAVLNAADEVATQAFLDGTISFPRITQIVETVLHAHRTAPIASLEQILEVDAWARREATSCIQV